MSETIIPGDILDELRWLLDGDISHLIALSIKQPYANLILSGEKHIEKRTRQTQFRGRFLIYASKKKSADVHLDTSLSLLKPKGLIVGSVDLIGCIKLETGDWAWQLNNPRRAHNLLLPSKTPKQSWFRPF